MSTFVTFEGIDGAGKTTVSRLVAEALSERGLPHLLVDRRNPTFADPYVAESARRLSGVLWPDRIDDPQYLLGDGYFVLLTGAWLRLIDEQLVRPALAAGKVVIVDGWDFKPIARNALRPHIRDAFVAECFADLTRPHVVCLATVAPTLAEKRKGPLSNAESGRNDGYAAGDGFVDYQARVAEVLERAVVGEGARLVRLDGVSPPDESALQVLRALGVEAPAPQPA